VKYDLIVIGAGPGGVMAARTAAQDGLRVALLERKKNVTDINRACVQIFYLNKLDANWLTMKPTPKMDAYIENVSIDISQDRCEFRFKDAGFILGYEGPLRAYYNWIHFSPSGYSMNRYPFNNSPWGFYYKKRVFLAALLEDALNAGVDLLTETTASKAENTGNMVEVSVTSPKGNNKYFGKAAIVADGLNSRVVDAMGLNKERPLRALKPRQILIYVMEGVTCPFSDNSWVMWSIPSLGADNIYMGLGPNNCNLLGAGSSSSVTPAAALDGLMKWPAYAPWFAKAHVVEKMATTLVSRPALKQVVSGNIVVIGDAGASVESWIQGATACGYKAAKSIQTQLGGENGYKEYTEWWSRAFAFNLPEYPRMATDPMRGALKSLGSLFSKFGNDDFDSLYKFLQGETGIPSLLAASRLDELEKKLPDLYAKIQVG
jgi:flavin-dependent dehydrogenase